MARPDESLQILYEDNHVLAVAKPAPLLTQAPPGVPSLEAIVKQYLRDKYDKKGRVYLGVPHRLDRPVSGVVLFARQTKSAQRLAEQFRERQVAKIYWAAVEGTIEPPEGQWEHWLRKLPEQARSESVAAETPGARHAVVRYRILQPCAGGTLVAFQPLTGRMHQIRVQTARRGHPVQGDLLYGAKALFGASPAAERDRVIALHARTLTFQHPIRFEPICVTAPLPPIWHLLGISDTVEAALLLEQRTS